MKPDERSRQQIPSTRRVRLAYLVSHPIQYQAPLLRRIAREPDIDLTVLFGSDFSVRGYKDEGFGVQVAWDVPLLDGYRHEFLPAWRDAGGVSATTPVSRKLFRRLRGSGTQPAFDALWVHGYASLNSIQAILAANALGIPVLLRAESWLADRERSPLKLLVKSAFLRTVGAGIAAVLPIGSHNAAYWRHYFGTLPQFPMPYAVDNAFFARRAASAALRLDALRLELGLDPRRPVILFASKLQPRKHADHLIEAFHQLVAGEPPGNSPYLLIVGDGEERERLERLSRERGLTGVCFAGFRNQSELPAFFALASVFVLPSRHEPWGLIVNEVMSTGCPVILSSDVGAAADLVRDGVEGWVYPVGDIVALREALRRTLASPAVAAQMGEAARERMRSWTFEEDIAGLRAALAYTTRKLVA